LEALFTDGRGWSKSSKIMRRRESLVLLKSFNTLWQTTFKVQEEVRKKLAEYEGHKAQLTHFKD
jgi:hypothetical protein